MTDEARRAPAETKPMPRVAGRRPPPSAEPDEDTLSGLEGVPAVDTMVVPPDAGPRDRGTARTPGAGSRSEHFGVRAARLVVALAVVAGAPALLVLWLLGQSQ